ncbi:GNAT family N-acetyltransferase [Flavobacteriaceae bacterium S356]|uniref:GNAT family N-acetyltransferase n=1 Tax=Asprobacillus argus TaxID=3076534 RepID=A0ABU3LH75_9FLAO|nr:GNAT family N-acetyltransferase [Flavobacteriaceae bacterium S356]
MNLDQLQFLQLDLNGLKTLVSWARLEGWNPGPFDADVFYQTDPDGFYGYFLKGELIGGGSIVSYDGLFGFMGFFIVKPEYRSQGIGKLLWYQRRNKLLSRLQPNAAIGMDGVIAMQPFYQKGGFEIAFRDERYERKGASFKSNPCISNIDKSDVSKILSYDIQCFGVSRSKFLQSWLFMPESHTFKYVKSGELKGFAIIRKASTGYKICPLFADNLTIAEALYQACLNVAVNEPVYIDVPVINKEAIDLIRKYQATYVFECARMYYGESPKMEINKVFGITTFELG